MLPPENLNSPEAVFAALEEGIDICDRQIDGEVSLSIRRIGGSEEFELRVFSLRGSFRCQGSDLQRFLECGSQKDRLQKEQNPVFKNSVLKYRERFRHGLRDILPNGFGLLKLDFTECRRGRFFPKFSATVTKLCKQAD